MPFYEYECPSCRYYLEVLQKITDRPLKKCPSCGKAGFKRLVSAPVFRLKGSGWYETDFKSDKDSKRNLAGADREDAKASEGTGAKATGEEAKTAAPASGKDDKAGVKAEAKAPASAGAGEKPAARSKKAAPVRTPARGSRSAARPAARRAPRPAPRRQGGR
jgi:putative FmdB family regulatory protein